MDPTNQAAPQILSGMLRRKWRIVRPLGSGKNWQTYLLEHFEEKTPAFLIQRNFSAAGSDLNKWKHDFAKYCSERSQARLPLPAVLDRFTEGESLYLVESAPELEWKTLQEGSPADPVTWAQSFFAGLDAIGAHGNPDMETVRWRGSAVLFCCTTFPQLDGNEATPDTPAWLAQVAESAFQQDIAAVLKRSDLSPKLRERLQPLQPGQVTRHGEPSAHGTPGPSAGHREEKKQTVSPPPAVTRKQEEGQTSPPKALPPEIPAAPPPPTHPTVITKTAAASRPERTKSVKSTPPSQPSRKRAGWPIALLVFGLLLVGGAVATWIWKYPGNTPQADNPTPSPTASTSPSPTETPTQPAEIQRVEIQYFTVQPQEVRAGQPVTLSWKVANAQRVWIRGIDREPQKVGATGSKSVTLLKTADIVLEAEGSGTDNSASALRSVHIIADPPPQAAMPRIPYTRVSATMIGSCRAWLVQWKVIGNAQVSIVSEGGGVTVVPFDYTVLRQPGRYELRASNSGGTATHPFTLTASARDKLCN